MVCWEYLHSKGEFRGREFVSNQEIFDALRRLAKRGLYRGLGIGSSSLTIDGVQIPFPDGFGVSNDPRRVTNLDALYEFKSTPHPYSKTYFHKKTGLSEIFLKEIH